MTTKYVYKENFDTIIASESVEEKLRQMLSQITDWSDELINEKCIKKLFQK